MGSLNWGPVRISPSWITTLGTMILTLLAPIWPKDSAHYTRPLPLAPDVEKKARESVACLSCTIEWFLSLQSNCKLATRCRLRKIRVATVHPRLESRLDQNRCSSQEIGHASNMTAGKLPALDSPTAANEILEPALLQPGIETLTHTLPACIPN